MPSAKKLIYFFSAFAVGSAVLAAVVFGFSRELRPSGLFEINRVPVEFISADGLETSKLAPKADKLNEKLRSRVEGEVGLLKGKRLWEVDLKHLQASLAHDEWVSDISISRRLPNEIRVRVKPKRAVAALLVKQDDFMPVAEDGALLSPVAASELPDVPILRGEAFGPAAGEDGIRRRTEMIKFLAALNEKSLLGPQNVSEIAWVPSDGYVLTLVQPRVEVKLGDERVDLKAMRVAQVLSYLSVNNLKGRVIDASFSKKVLVRLHKGP